MKIKICGLFREEDIGYVNEARPDFVGFVFAPSKRQVSPALAARLKERLAAGIEAVGVFVNAPVEDIAALYADGVISFAQLHGTEDSAYIERLREASVAAAAKRRKAIDAPLPVIKALKAADPERVLQIASTAVSPNAAYYLVDSGAGSGETFNWNILRPASPFASWLKSTGKPWFLAGGITADNIKEAMAFNPFGVDISGGAETNGIKDREKIVRLIAMAREGTL